MCCVYTCVAVVDFGATIPTCTLSYSHTPHLSFTVLSLLSLLSLCTLHAQGARSEHGDGRGCERCERGWGGSGDGDRAPPCELAVGTSRRPCVTGQPHSQGAGRSCKLNRFYRGVYINMFVSRSVSLIILPLSLYLPPLPHPSFILPLPQVPVQDEGGASTLSARLMSILSQSLRGAGRGEEAAVGLQVSLLRLLSQWLHGCDTAVQAVMTSLANLFLFQVLTMTVIVLTMAKPLSLPGINNDCQCLS